jgi:hypothetical protein
MKWRMRYTLTAMQHTLDWWSLPISFRSGVCGIVIERETPTTCVAVADADVDSFGLTMVPDEMDPSGEVRNSGGIEIENRPPLGEFVNAVIDGLALIYGGPVQASVQILGRLVPESPEDADVLSRLGTDRTFDQFSAIVRVASSMNGLDLNGTLEKLLPRHAGLTLFHEAQLLDRPVSQYREFWRVLESAFGRQDDELVALLASYEPARARGFTEQELRGLMVLRGRASHAASRSGLREIRGVARLVSDQLIRLEELAKTVLLTKRSWGFPTTEVDDALTWRAAAVQGETQGEA